MFYAIPPVMEQKKTTIFGWARVYPSNQGGPGFRWVEQEFQDDKCFHDKDGGRTNDTESKLAYPAVSAPWWCRVIVLLYEYDGNLIFFPPS